jgi:penicillin amidase
MTTEPASTVSQQTPSASALRAGHPPRRRLRRFGRRLAQAALVLAGLLLLVILGAALWLRQRMVENLPATRGRLVLPGLGAPVVVERDALGVPTLRAATRLDAARALGFVHAQERYFQMDALRRVGAAEMAELVGPGALAFDRKYRVHRFRSVARQILEQLPPHQRALAEAYTAGVNAGLRALRGKPFEYSVLRAEPQPWRAEDVFLPIFAMYIELNHLQPESERELGLLRARVPPALYAFVQPPGTEWDAPLVGPVFGTPRVPGPEVVDLRAPRAAALAAPAAPAEPASIEALTATGADGESPWERRQIAYGLAGSNSWAISSAHTADGRALLANDMHLGLGVPNIWFRASWSWREAGGSERRVTGVTLPGVPLLASGSTGRIAWGFSNSYVDNLDLVDLELDPKDPDLYRTPAGMRHFAHHAERIRVRGAPEVILDVADTIWGPVIARDARGRAQRAMAWTAHLPAATNLGLGELESARTVDDAIEVAHAAGLPPQNFVVADSSGRVGWTYAGRVPRRIGWDGQVPSSWADGTHRWYGWLRSDEIPKVVDPPSGRVWASNNRLVDGDMLARIGDGGFELGARARQVRDRLLGLERATPRDLLAIQLDDRALLLARWHDLLLGVLTPEAIRADPRRGELRGLLVSTWSGRASVDSVAYRVVREFHDALAQEVFSSVTGLSAEDGPASERFEGALWRLVTERPAHLLDRRYKSWAELLLAQADREREKLQALGPRLADRTWGEHNTVRIRHPLSRALPPLAPWLDMPVEQIPGDLNVPRLMGPNYGASERLVVSPGHEETGIFHMPAGESGDPVSPHYRDGNAAWRKGEPTPFLPGPPRDVLQLVPSGGR